MILTLVRHATLVLEYAGRRLLGRVRTTWLRGVPVDGGQPRGRLLRSGQP